MKKRVFGVFYQNTDGSWSGPWNNEVRNNLESIKRVELTTKELVKKKTEIREVSRWKKVR